ncbi:NADH dehydrogenase [ubiquinone] 1 subunit C2 isoform X1 [Lampetra fluviatilis]
MIVVPDEAKSLQPPSLLNVSSLVLGLTGWGSALAANAAQHRPAWRSATDDVDCGAAGLHRQAFMFTACWVAGYYLQKRANYMQARANRDVALYVAQHPQDFKPEEKRKFKEVLEPAHPIY